MEKKQGSSRGKWALVFACEAALVVTIVVLIVLFSVPIERKLMDTVRDLYHAKEVKYSQYQEKANVFTLMNLDERVKGNRDLRNPLIDDAEWHFLYHDFDNARELSITSLHFSSHNQAREYFYTLPDVSGYQGGAGHTLLDWHEISDSRVTGIAFRSLSTQTNREVFQSYIVYLESKSVVLIQYSSKQALNDIDREKLSELCYALSLPNPLDEEDTLSDRASELEQKYSWIV